MSRSPLLRRDYALIWTAGLVSDTGDWLLMIALPLFAFSATGSALGASAVFLAELIPMLLAGTFLGVLCAYGFFGPMAQSLRNIFEAESKYYLSMKAGLLAHMAGYAPAVSIEFARKALMSEVRPTFSEVEQSTANLQTAAS